jgi:hypothetical protein
MLELFFRLAGVERAATMISMIRTLISFDEPLYKSLKAEAKRQKKTLAFVCREACARFIAAESQQTKDGAKWKAYVGCIEAGTVDESSSENIDHNVYGRPV